MSGPADLDPGSITDVRDSSGPRESPVRFAPTASASWLTAVVAVAAFAGGILLSGTLIPERQDGGARFATSPTAAAPGSTSPSPAPSWPAVGEIKTDPNLEATLPDTFEGHRLVKSSITGPYADRMYDLQVRGERIAELAGGNFWSYAVAALDPRAWGPSMSVEALVITGYPLGDLLEAFATYSQETAEERSVACDYLTVGERRVVRCGAVMPDIWFGPPYWDGGYAYASGVTLYVINGVGGIDDDPSNLRSLETILGELP